MEHPVLMFTMTLGVVVAVLVVIIVTRLSLEVVELKRTVAANHEILEALELQFDSSDPKVKDIMAAFRRKHNAR